MIVWLWAPEEIFLKIYFKLCISSFSLKLNTSSARMLTVYIMSNFFQLQKSPFLHTACCCPVTNGSDSGIAEAYKGHEICILETPQNWDKMSFEYPWIKFQWKNGSTFSHLLTVRAEGADPPPLAVSLTVNIRFYAFPNKKIVIMFTNFQRKCV